VHRFIGVEDAQERLYNRTDNCTEALNGVVGRTFSAENGHPELTRFSSTIKGIACEMVGRMRRIDMRQEEKPQRRPPNICAVPPQYAAFAAPLYLQFGERRVQVGPLPPALPRVGTPPPSPVLPRDNTPPIGLEIVPAEPAPADDVFWVMCTACNKWRKVPDDLRAALSGLGDDDLWTCHQADWFADVAENDRCNLPADG